MSGGPLSYEPFFGLTKKPFSLASDPAFLYESPSHAAALATLIAGIRRREGLLAFTGDVGTGKTTICRAVLRNLDRTTFSAFIPDPFASREDLLKMLLIDFGVTTVQDITTGPLAGAGRTELSYLLSSFLDTLAPLDAFVVVFIDEAQNMSQSLIEEVRILSDAFNRQGQMQLVFVGQLEFLTTLRSPEMRQVDQRVSVYTTLDPLSADDTVGYVHHRLQVAGASANRPMFTPTAMTLIHQTTGGIPRLINRLCDRALHLAWERRSPMIDRDMVAELVDGPAVVATVEPSAVVPPQPTVETASAFHAKVDEWLEQVDRGDSETAGLAAFVSELQAAADGTQESAEVAVFELPLRTRRPQRYIERLGRKIARGALAASLALVALNVVVAATSYVPRTWSDHERAELPPLPAPPQPQLPRVLFPSPPQPEPALAATAAPAATDSAAQFAVAVGAFSTRTRAALLAETLVQTGFTSFTRTASSRDGVLQQVFIGPFETEAAAARELERLRSVGPYDDARVMPLRPAGAIPRMPDESDR